MSELKRMQAAADWLIQLQEASGDEALVAAWLKWCDEDPANLPAFQRAQAVWQAAVPRFADVPRARRQWTWPLAAAALLLCAVGVALWISMRSLPPTLNAQSYATPVGGRGLSILPDGSKVDLGAGSRITTTYSRATRSITLDSGDAFFLVKKDAHRPFVVSAGTLDVMAVGTAFDVRRGDDRVVVAVQEGRVRVRDHFGGDLATVGAGEEAVYLEKPRHVALSSIKPTDAAAWRDGILRYEQEPLSAVTADLNRYSNRHIVIRDPDLEALPFTGTILTAHIDDALRGLSDIFPLSVVEHDDRIELVRR